MGGSANRAQDRDDRAGAGAAAPVGRWYIRRGSRAGPLIPLFITRQGRGMNDRWPVQDFLERGALASAVPCARLHARQVLRECRDSSKSRVLFSLVKGT